jgi:hypothetical protein
LLIVIRGFRHLQEIRGNSKADATGLARAACRLLPVVVVVAIARVDLATGLSRAARLRSTRVCTLNCWAPKKKKAAGTRGEAMHDRVVG